MAAVRNHHETRIGDARRHFPVYLDRGQRIVGAAENQRMHMDASEIGAAVRAVHDRGLLAQESVAIKAYLHARRAYEDVRRIELRKLP